MFLKDRYRKYFVGSNMTVYFHDASMLSFNVNFEPSGIYFANNKLGRVPEGVTNPDVVCKLFEGLEVRSISYRLELGGACCNVTYNLAVGDIFMECTDYAFLRDKMIHYSMNEKRTVVEIYDYDYNSYEDPVLKDVYEHVPSMIPEEVQFQMSTVSHVMTILLAMEDLAKKLQDQKG